MAWGGESAAAGPASLQVPCSPSPNGTTQVRADEEQWVRRISSPSIRVRIWTDREPGGTTATEAVCCNKVCGQGVGVGVGTSGCGCGANRFRFSAVMFIHASLRLRNLKNKMENKMEGIGLKRTPMGIVLDALEQQEDITKLTDYIMKGKD